jgi:hypothetical protein
MLALRNVSYMVNMFATVSGSPGNIARLQVFLQFFLLDVCIISMRLAREVDLQFLFYIPSAFKYESACSTYIEYIF